MRYRNSLFIILLLASAWGAMRDRLVFSHKLHIQDAGMSCEDCHPVVGRTGGDGPAMPDKSTCGACHEQVNQEGQCGMCHTNPDKPEKLRRRTVHREFSHRKHLERVSGCSACHQEIETQGEGGEYRLPGMDVCGKCHDNRQASGECSQCHRGILKKPDSHGQGWLGREMHGNQSKLRAEQCRSCHRTSFCDGCHQGQVGIRIHDPNYRFTHGREARRKKSDCAVCHQVSRFCSSCH